MNESLRQKRIASLIQEILSSHLIILMQDSTAGMVTVTRVDISKDLKTAQVYFSILGEEDPEDVVRRLRGLEKSLRKSVASRSKLKYNPKLIFSLDPQVERENRIDQLLSGLKDHEH